MVNIIVQLSKYLMILMITVYTYLCFSIFGYYDPDKKKRCLRKQNVLMFVMHLTAFLVMYLEKEMLEKVNKLGIGPQGFGGKTTAIGLNIETMPTHIAGMPCAVNINCHVTRHKTEVI